MAYKPVKTPLLVLAKTVGKGWQRARGVEVSLEQGYVQFELWTGRRVPKKVVTGAMLKKYESS